MEPEDLRIFIRDTSYNTGYVYLLIDGIVIYSYGYDGKDMQDISSFDAEEIIEAEDFMNFIEIYLTDDIRNNDD